MKILLIRFSSIGDVILTTPLLRALRTAYPDAVVHFATRRAFAPLLEGNPNVDRILVLPDREEGGLRALARTIRAERYDHILDCGTLRAPAPHPGARPALAGYRKHAPSLGVDATETGWFRAVVPVAERYLTRRRLRRAARRRAAGGVPSAAARKRHPRRCGRRDRRGVRRHRAGAQHATKRWPEASWAELARRLIGAGLRVVVVGGPEDAEASDWIAASSGATSVAGALDLPGSAAVLQGARALASGDTGVMHLATAVGTPVVALFDPTVRSSFFPTAAVRRCWAELYRPCSTHGGPAPVGSSCMHEGRGTRWRRRSWRLQGAGRHELMTASHDPARLRPAAPPHPGAPLEWPGSARVGRDQPPPSAASRCSCFPVSTGATG